MAQQQDSPNITIRQKDNKNKRSKYSCKRKATQQGIVTTDTWCDYVKDIMVRSTHRKFYVNWPTIGRDMRSLNVWQIRRHIQ